MIANPRMSRATVEGLERRVLMSVTAAALAGPVTVPGNSWTYNLYNTSNGFLGTETLTSEGANTSYSIQPCIEIDVADAKTAGTIVATGKMYYGFQSQAYLLYESTLTSSAGTTDTVYSSPYHLIDPASLSAGSPVNTPAATSTATYTPTTGTPTVITTNTYNTITLVSNTPDASTTVPKGNFNCYQSNSTTTNASNGTQAPNVTETFVNPSIGLVEVVDSTGTGTGTLTGATPVTTVGGVATFSD